MGALQALLLQKSAELFPEEQGIKYLQGFHICAQKFKPLYTLFSDDAQFPGISCTQGCLVDLLCLSRASLLVCWVFDYLTGTAIYFLAVKQKMSHVLMSLQVKVILKIHAILRDQVDLLQF